MHPDQIKWNKKYAERGIANFPQEPSLWLQNHKLWLERDGKSRALDIACGNGRNSVFLAKLGYQVDAIDISDVAVDWLKAKAARQKLALFPVHQDLDNVSFPDDYYQVVCNFYFLNRHLFPEMIKALSSEGLLFFETFTQDHLAFNPKMNPDFCLYRNELLAAFQSLHILHYREFVIEDKQGKPRAIAQLMAQKL